LFKERDLKMAGIMIDRATRNCVLGSAFVCLILMLPTLNYYYNWDLPMMGFPLALLSNGIGYMSIFFHEIGHTIFSWGYGYVTVPYFDFFNGGGMSMPLSEQSHLLSLFILSGGAYGIFLIRDYRVVFWLAMGLWLFLFITSFMGFHETVILFMGHVSELIVGSFFIYRALMNWVVKAGVERHFYAIIGFFMIFSNIRDFIGLIVSDIERNVYAAQKGAFHMGDFSRIAIDELGVSLEAVSGFAFAIAMILLILPFVVYAFERRYIEAENIENIG